MRGDAVIYLWDDESVGDALGYHDENHKGIPYGFVFPKISERAGEDWTVTLSHEALELIADADANLFVQGPHPTEPRRNVFFWYEVCDAVQAETYKIDGVELSNFLLPMYFTRAPERDGRNDFLNHAHSGQTLQSFGVNPGGYIGYFDPVSSKNETYMMKGDRIALKRKRAKAKRELTQRSARYSIPPDGVPR
jgi:hypothetical protein